MVAPPPTEPLVPASEDTERAVLGALLIDPSKVSDVVAALKPHHFYLEKHGSIYQAILEIDKVGGPVDFLTVTRKLEVEGKLAIVGGPDYIMGLFDAVPTAAHVDHYVEAMLRLASDRAAIEIASQAAQRAFTSKGEALQWLASVTAEKMTEFIGGDDGPMWLDDATDRVVEGAVDLYSRRAKGEVVDLMTPWQELNDIIISLLPSDYVVLTAPPSFGKSTVVHQIIDYAARLGHGSLFITTETTADSVASRQLGKTVQMSPRLIRAGAMSQQGLSRLVSMKDQAKIGPVLIDDKITSFDQVERCILQAKRKMEANGYILRLVVVDFMHQLTKSGHDSENTSEKLGAISYGLRRLAGKYKVALIAVSEVDKASYATGGKSGTKNASGSAKIHYSAALGWTLNKTDDDRIEFTVDKNKDGPGGKFILPAMTRNAPWFGQ